MFKRYLSQKKVIALFAQVVIVAVAAGVSVAVASLTFTNTDITGTSGTTLDVTNASTTNVSSTNIDVTTRFNFAAASGTGNLTVTGANTQITNQLTFANASGTNLDVATRLNFTAASSTGNLTTTGSLHATGQTTLVNVSSTRETISTSLMLGGGTAMTKMVCNSTSSKISSTATAATSTVGIEVTGLSTSTNQAYWWNLASTSPGFADFQLMSIQVSSTISTAVPRADLFFKNWSLATFAPAGNVTTTLCYTQF